jgi:hypothetical protein
MSSGTDGARFGPFTTDEYKEMLKGHLTSHDVTCLQGASRASFE